MAHGEKWKVLWDGLSSSNRFWGAVVFVAGCGVALLPGLQIIGGATAALGANNFLTGSVTARRRKMVEEGKIEPTLPKTVKDSSESK